MLLSLDLGMSTGWSLCEGLGQPKYGTKKFEGALIETAPAFYRWLAAMIADHGVTEIAIESVIMTEHFNHEERVFSWRTVVFVICGLRNIKLWDVAVNEWRKYYLNGAQPPKGLPSEKRRAWFKKRALEIGAEKGWPCKTDDEAEALGVMDYVRAVKNPTHGIKHAPLFQQPAF